MTPPSIGDLAAIGPEANSASRTPSSRRVSSVSARTFETELVAMLVGIGMALRLYCEAAAKTCILTLIFGEENFVSMQTLVGGESFDIQASHILLNSA